MRKASLIAVLAAVLLAPVGARATQGFDSVEVAVEQGISAYKGGYYEIAIPALEYAAKRDDLLALFYLGRIYSNNEAAYTDHARAYKLYQRIISVHGDIDPDRVHHVRVVAKALTAVAGYILNGLPAIGLKPDVARAAQFLGTAADVWNEPDAQYELAKLHLRGEPNTNPDIGRYWLVVLSKKGHAPAQAYFADMLWRGRLVAKDQNRALAMITLAVENAPPEDRIWIEDIYQNIFCGTSMGTRRQADGLVAVWSRSFGRPQAPSGRSALGGLEPQLTRACGNGESIPMPRPIGAKRDADIPAPPPRSSLPSAETAATPVLPSAQPPPRLAADAPPTAGALAPPAAGFMRGATSMGLIDAGSKSLAPPAAAR